MLDNAKTFKGAEKEIRTLFRHPEVRAEQDKGSMVGWILCEDGEKY